MTELRDPIIDVSKKGEDFAGKVSKGKIGYFVQIRRSTIMQSSNSCLEIERGKYGAICFFYHLLLYLYQF